MKSFKKRWEAELDAVIPAMSEEVKNEPISRRELVENVRFEAAPTPWYKQVYDVLFSTPKRLASSLSVCMVGLLVVGSSLYFALSPHAPLTAEAEVISVEVNPQAVFTVDKNGIVTAVVAANNEADIVLSEDRAEGMEGKAVEEAVRIFVDYTAQLGYLDLENPDAVRISSCTENGRLNAVGETLESYFQKLGAYVAVVEQTLELPEFCQRVNMGLTNTVDALKSSIERIPALSFEREVEGKEGTELQTIYQENVTQGDIEDLFFSSVSNGVQKIEDFKKIDELYEKIFSHDDNPGYSDFIPIPKDYWNIKSEEIPVSMIELMAEMQKSLLDYELNYGVKIQDYPNLIEERLNCSASALQTLTQVLLNYTLDVLGQQFSIVIDILNTLHIDTTLITSLCELPEGLEDYTNKLGEYTHARYEALWKDNRSAYIAERAEISADAYEAYINGLIAEHGSLVAYFDNL